MSKGEQLFTRAESEKTRRNGFELKEGRFRLHIRKKFFTQRAVMPCPGGAEGWVGWALSWWGVPSRGLKWMGFKAPSNPNHSMILWN